MAAVTHMLGFATIRNEEFPNKHLDLERWRSLSGEFADLQSSDVIAVGSGVYDVQDSAELLDDESEWDFRLREWSN